MRYFIRNRHKQPCKGLIYDAIQIYYSPRGRDLSLAAMYYFQRSGIYSELIDVTNLTSLVDHPLIAQFRGSTRQTGHGPDFHIAELRLLIARYPGAFDAVPA